MTRTVADGAMLSAMTAVDASDGDCEELTMADG
jgi:hypothetical protein